MEINCGWLGDQLANLSSGSFEVAFFLNCLNLREIIFNKYKGLTVGIP